MAKPTKAQARKLVTTLLYARRNSNILGEQRAYEKLAAWCARYNVNMENAINGVARELQQQVAPIMNSLV